MGVEMQRQGTLRLPVPKYSFRDPRWLRSSPLSEASAGRSKGLSPRASVPVQSASCARWKAGSNLLVLPRYGARPGPGPKLASGPPPAGFPPAANCQR